VAPWCAADNNGPITLDTNETLFAVLTAMNSCGYDVDLTGSDAQRLNIRAEVQKNLRESEEAQAALTTMCDWYVAHRGKDPQHDLSQFVSLALYLQGPPHFMPRVKEDDMPPDAGPIAGFGALLEKFYEKASLHAVWEAHRASYAALVARYHEPLAKMVFDTDIYLKLQSAHIWAGRSRFFWISWAIPLRRTPEIMGPTTMSWSSLLRTQMPANR